MQGQHDSIAVRHAYVHVNRNGHSCFFDFFFIQQRRLTGRKEVICIQRMGSIVNVGMSYLTLPSAILRSSLL